MNILFQNPFNSDVQMLLFYGDEIEDKILNSFEFLPFSYWINTVVFNFL